jgi:hypothetical protein
MIARMPQAMIAGGNSASLNLWRHKSLNAEPIEKLVVGAADMEMSSRETKG